MKNIIGIVDLLNSKPAFIRLLMASIYRRIDTAECQKLSCVSKLRCFTGTSLRPFHKSSMCQLDQQLKLDGILQCNDRQYPLHQLVNFRISRRLYVTIRYDTIEEFNVDWKAEYSASSSTRSQKKKLKQPTPVPL